MMTEFAIHPGRRAYHTLLAASFGIAFVSDFGHLRIHVQAGYLAGLLVLLRVTIEAARRGRRMFEDYLVTPKEVAMHWKDLAAGRVVSRAAHNPSSAAMALVLMTLVTATVLSGFLAFGAGELQGPAAGLVSAHAWRMGPVLETLHGILARVTLALVCLHAAGAVYESIRGERNWVRLIFTDKDRTK